MELFGWGRYPRINARGTYFETGQGLRRTIEKSGDILARGMGRGYGDCALNPRVVFTRRYDRLIDFDPVEGVLYCESGTTLSDLIRIFLPRGWFPPVVPGTRFITVGGAIAADVHGKSHHKDGCFSRWVEQLELMTADGSIVSCSKRTNRELFLATCGGMGLTGVILRAKIKLKPVKSAWIRETVIRAKNLHETLSLFEAYKDTTFSVGWIDCLEKGKNLGRSVVMLGEHADAGTLDFQTATPRSVPLDFPCFILNKTSVGLFNHAYYHRSPAYVEKRLVPLEKFFFPLDGITNWNRMYGRKGFIQYQFVLPLQNSREGMKRVLARTAKSEFGPFLSVIKLFGPENDNYLSFPMEGCTLTMDFKMQKELPAFLEQLDRIVVEHGGRLYLAKDPRMSREVFLRGYPKAHKFLELRKKLGLYEKFQSLQSRRLGV